MKLRLFFYSNFILLSFLFTSCSEVNTTNADKAYKYWTGTNPPADLKLLNAQYWQSPHWTKEYIIYLKLKTTTEWWNQYIKENRMTIDTISWTKPSDAPNWFQPSNNCIKYNLSPSTGYFRDTINDDSYIYEMQL